MTVGNLLPRAPGLGKSVIEPAPEKTAKAPSGPSAAYRQLLCSRHTLIWVVTGEERRAERAIATASVKEGYDVRYWDCSTGCKSLEGETVAIPKPEGNPHSIVEKIRARDIGGPCVWVLRDLPDLFPGDPYLLRAIKSLARDLQEELEGSKQTTVVVLSPSGEVPVGLRGSAAVIDWPLPSRPEIGKILDQVIQAAPPGVTKPNGDRERIIDAAAGLVAEDIASAFSVSIVKHNRVDATEVSGSKKAIIKRDGLLEWHDPDPRGMDAIGGLSLLKQWLMERRLAFSPQARAYGLPPVKGLLLCGPSGTGKSLTAKCCATIFDVPLLRLDPGAMKGSLMGESEQKIRRALKTAEAVQRCVLWTDELEKAIAGSRGPSGDSGVSADQLATLLTWRQECELPIFWLATCNDPTALPPELISRFDEVFFVDLPTISERAEILASELKKVGRPPGRFDLFAVAAATEGWSGRELHKLVAAGMFRAFASKREVSTEDLILCSGESKPVSFSASEAVAAQRKWADGRARPASSPDPALPARPAAAAGFGRVGLTTIAAGAAGEQEEE